MPQPVLAETKKERETVTKENGRKYKRTKGNTTTVSGLCGRKSGIKVISISGECSSVTVQLTGEQWRRMVIDAESLLLHNDDVLPTEPILTIRLEPLRAMLHFISRKKNHG